MKRISSIVLIMLFVGAAQSAQATDEDRAALLEWAHNAPQAAAITPATSVPAAQSKSAPPESSEPKPLFVERNPESTNPPKPKRPGIADLARSAERSVTFSGSLVGRACKGFARTTRATIDGKPQYMRRDERTARYNNVYNFETEPQPYSPLQTGAKTIHEVSH